MDGKFIHGETPIDPSGLKVKGITTRAELNELEAENTAKALTKYLGRKPTHRMAPFALTWARRFHKEMFGKVWNWAGVFRTHDLNIGLPWQQLEVSVQSLLDDLKSWSGFGVALPEQAVRLHHRAVAIHPFQNGNGRWSRALANIWLKLHDQPITLWPEPTLGAESPIRDEYLKAIKAADEGDYSALAEMHRQYAEVPLDWLDTGEPTFPPEQDNPNL